MRSAADIGACGGGGASPACLLGTGAGSPGSGLYHVDIGGLLPSGTRTRTRSPCARRRDGGALRGDGEGDGEAHGYTARAYSCGGWLTERVLGCVFACVLDPLPHGYTTRAFSG